MRRGQDIAFFAGSIKGVDKKPSAKSDRASKDQRILQTLQTSIEAVLEQAASHDDRKHHSD